MRANIRAGLVIGLWVAVTVLAGTPRVSAAGDGVEKISAGEYHTCALRTGGTVWCWGRNIYGQLGDGTRGDANYNRVHPVKVKQGAGFLTDVKAIGAGAGHSCAVKNNGTVWCWARTRMASSAMERRATRTSTTGSRPSRSSRGPGS